MSRLFYRWRIVRIVSSHVLVLYAPIILAGDPTPIPPQTVQLLSRYCLDCHDAETEKGDINLEHAAIDWSDPKSRHLWERVLKVNDDGLMPPEKKPQPTVEDRDLLASWLDASLLEHTPIGGTLPRRLSKAEYQTTIRKLFDLPDFTLPAGFPTDTERHGFDNIGEGLVMSPPLLEAISKVAWQVADELYPPERATPKSVIRSAGPEDMVISFSASSVRGDALRLASRDIDIMRSCTWPSRMEITVSGTYQITVGASTFKPNEKGLHKGPMILEIKARDVAASDRAKTGDFRLLKEIEVRSERPETYSFKADLYEGQTVIFRWKNGMLDHAVKEFLEHVKMRFEKDRRFLAAWQETVLKHKGNVVALRGRNGWDKVKAHYYDKNLDMSHATMDSKETDSLLRLMSKTTTFHDTFVHDYYDHGPALELHKVSIEGPLKLVDGPKEKRRARLRRDVAGVDRDGLSDEDYASRILENFLPRAFRRPADKQTMSSFLRIATRHWEAGHSFDEGMHVMIRAILMSPRFLYRALAQPGKLDDHNLATRLSYFLTQGPPDAELLALAESRKLSNPKVLRSQALRLLPKEPTAPMVQSFTGQWLDTNLLAGIMPSAEFNFNPQEIALAKSEVEWFFTEILNENLPMTDFIDPDFMFTSKTFAHENYELDRGSAKDTQLDVYKRKDMVIKRLPIKRGGRYGGLIGQSAIMMATANGVDTQPVLRGVWVLENILGTPPPEPPDDVPALTPDTQGAKTPRDLLAKHTEDAACAKCHQRIDPFGLMLENFDPVGNWRETWPKSGMTIDPATVLPDGTRIGDVTDFKHWLVNHIDQFSNCLAQKLMTYATGRALNYTEIHEVKAIVKKNQLQGNGFKDLLLGLIASKTFQIK